MSSMPTWAGFMAPVLTVMNDGQSRTFREIRVAAADVARLTEEQRTETLGSGQRRSDNRIGWATSLLTRAGALERPRRGTYVMTDVGRRLLSDNPGGISEHTLKALPAYQAHEPVSRQAIDALAASGDDTDLDPTEQMDAGARRIRATVAVELLRRLREQDPAFLEQSVLDVLVAMGYGGVDQRARRIGGSGDGGVDGVIDQDALGLARIYVQAKRYAADNLIGRPTIQGFVGALQGHQSTQGIFITTSSFSREAADYAARVSASVILIDGERLAELMIAYGVAVQVVKTFVAVEVDDNYFE